MKKNKNNQEEPENKKKIKKENYKVKQKIFSITLNLYYKKIKLEFSYN